MFQVEGIGGALETETTKLVSWPERYEAIFQFGGAAPL
jgi:hypothetical protein